MIGSFIKNNKTILLLVLIGAVITLPMVYLFMFAIPSADDFCAYTKINGLGFLDAQKYYYTNWTGRYSVVFFVSVLVRLLRIADYYWVYLTLILAVFIFALAYFVSTVFKEIRIKYLGIYFAVILLFFVLNLRSVTQGFFWFASSNTYTFSLALYMLFFSLLIKNSPTKVIKILVVGLTIFLVGMHEISMISVNLTLLFMLFVAYLTDRKDMHRLKYLVLLLAISSGASYVTITAPGNEVRLDAYPDSGKFLFSAVNSLFSGLKLIKFHLTDVSFLLLSLVTYLFGTFSKNGRDKNYILYFAFSFVVCVSLFFPSFYSTGFKPWDRVLDLIDGIFLVNWIYSVYLLGSSGNLVVEKVSFKLYALMCAAIITTFSFANYQLMADDYFTNTRLFSIENRERMEVLASSKDKDLVLAPYKNYPKSFQDADITIYPDSWVNVCFADYYGLKSVKRSE